MLRDHVCSRELAEKLKLLKVNQSSLFYYTNCGLVYQYEPTWHTGVDKEAWIAAFTLSELFQILERHDVEIEKDTLWTVWHFESNKSIARGASLLDTLAKALIFIYENSVKKEHTNVVQFKRK